MYVSSYQTFVPGAQSEVILACRISLASAFVCRACYMPMMSRESAQGYPRPIQTAREFCLASASHAMVDFAPMLVLNPQSPYPAMTCAELQGV